MVHPALCSAKTRKRVSPLCSDRWWPLSGSTILISAEDKTLQGLKTLLVSYGLRVIETADHSCALEYLRNDSLDLIILGASRKSAWDALEVAQQIRRSDGNIPLILITATSSEELAIAALKSGINDYFKQPFSPEQFTAGLKKRFSNIFRKEKLTSRRTSVSGIVEGEPMIGESASVREIKAYILKVAPTDSTVLITGETGTGKELVAQLIHKNSARCQKAFVCINCAAIPDSLLESELFGHERGAFTGAHSVQDGKLKLADAGTVFFDEIGDMSPCAQAKILRTLESKEVYRLGGQSSIPVNIRIVAATNQDLKKLTEEGKFRKDVFFRLNVARIVLPPLRNRKEDIPQLLDHYIRHFNRSFDQQVEGFEEETLQHLVRYDWPGNVRELRNLLEAIFVTHPALRISFMDLPDNIRDWFRNVQDRPPNEQDRLLSALLSTNWNKSRAAQRLHWSRMTLYRKLAKYHLVGKGVGISENIHPTGNK